MSKRNRNKPLFASIVLAATLLLSCQFAFATEPEDLTNVTVYDRDGRVVTVGIEPGTSTWSALADGQSFTIYTGLAPNEHGMWYCNAGRVDFNYTGLVEFQDEIWYVSNGKVDTTAMGEQEIGDQVYTIKNGKVVDQDYTTETKQKMALMVGGFFAFVALILFLKIRDNKKKKEHEEQFQKLLKESEERNRKFEEFEKQQKLKKAQEVYEEEVENPGLKYKRANILTNREKKFYPHLKEVADKYGWSVSLKPRLGDLVTGADNQFSGRGKVERYKVQQKHVDFALINTETQEVVLILELDDTTHDRQDRVNRDVFVDNVLRGTGYKILHVYDAENLEQRIIDEINGTPPEEESQ